tara:strand:- start:15136 stop:16092 length:957 start_codon:yes stop_codon:yes gene_type:complete
MAAIDKEYNKLVRKILAKGFRYEDPNRKGVHRIQIPRYTFEHSFEDGFPAITTKRLYWKGVVGELLWFLRGETNIKYLIDNGINIWNKDAYNYYLKEHLPENGTLTFNEFTSLIKQNKKSIYHELGDLGRVYGYQLRKFGGNFDQLQWIVDIMQEVPYATKKTVSFVNHNDKEYQALSPCHTGFKILVEPLGHNDKQFTLQFEQDSVDTFLGLPFNIASYALLAKILEALTGMKAKGIIGDLSNVHIYEKHLGAISTQLKNNPDTHWQPLQIKQINTSNYTKGDSIDQWLDNKIILDFELLGYNSFPSISAEMLSYNK